MAKQPTFYESLIKGATGYFAGLAAGGLFGIVMGGIGGAIVGAIALPAAEVAGAALVGAYIIGGTFATVGALAGMTTHVVKAHQEGHISMEDAVKMSQASAAQAADIVRQQVVEDMKSQSTDWQKKHPKKEHVEMAMTKSERTVVH